VEASEGMVATVDLGHAGKIDVQTRQSVDNAPAGPMEIGIRPEHLSICDVDDASSTLSGEAHLVERLGNGTTVYVNTGVGQLCVQTDSEAPVQSGDQIGVAFEANRAHLFANNAMAV
jgi:multiple sugar transport system ATP-binding protein